MTSDSPTSEPGRPNAEFVTVTVNLRQASADFLDRLSQEMGVDRSETCRQIIDLMLQNAESAEDGASGAENAIAALRDRARALPRAAGGSGKGEVDHGWTKWTIALDRRQSRRLTALAQADGHSVSRAIRRLIAAFVAKYERRGSKASGATKSRRQSTQRRRRGTAAQESPQAPRPVRESSPAKGSSVHRRWQLVLLLGALATAGIFFAPDEDSFIGGPTVVTAAPWADQHVDIIFDHHSHTTYSDGKLTVAELADLASEGGCDALAITDHSDAAGTASSLQLGDFRRTRQEHLGLLLFGGVEINMPSYGGREHANVIVDPAVEDEVLPRLRQVAEASIKEAKEASAKSASDEGLLRLAASYLARGDNLVMVYNHPSREDRKPDENAVDIGRWNAEAPIFVGFAGAPGHQNARNPGSYRKPMFPIDHWDPVVAEVGGTWDSLLSEGRQLWGAMAGSDFHNHKLDKSPCSFARTHIAAADYSYQAVLEALRAGTFWADHGQILRQLTFSAEVAGLESPVYPGSIVNLGGERGSIVARVALQRGAGSADAPLQVEFIGNCKTGETEMFAVELLEPDGLAAAAEFDPETPGSDNKSCFIRARLRLEIDEQPDLMAYTNPIRFYLR